MLNPRTIALKLEHHLFKKQGALLQKLVPAKTQASIRRRMRAKYLLWDARKYRAWLDQKLQSRRAFYGCTLEPGLLSILTPVWDGTPLNYFRLLADSVAQQNSDGAAEWVVLDNGCRNDEILAFLENVKQQHSWIHVVRSANNAGIIGGMRLCLEAASGRYVLPVDSDDWLYPDCLQIVTWWIRDQRYPPILYTDEDKLIGAHAVQPYLKPDFDPVLLLNSAYIAHLGVIDRRLAIEHDAYADKATEGSPDWDLFTRFYVAGLPAIHIPEVVYSWRMHPDSTADDAGSKPYIHSSQKAVLQRYLDSSGLAAKYDIEYSPLLKNTCDWRLQRRHVDPWPASLVTLTTGAKAAAQQIPDYPDVGRLSISPTATLSALAELVPASSDLVCVVSDDLEIDRSDWLWEALSLFERFPETVMVGARIRNSAGLIMSAGSVLGFGPTAADCPDRGRPALDPGYFTQVMKQRSVSAVSSQFAVLKGSMLGEIARQSQANATVVMLGEWAGAWARRNGKRIAYSPYLSAVSNIEWRSLASKTEVHDFGKANADLMPDQRFYPKAFGMETDSAYRLEHDR